MEFTLDKETKESQKKKLSSAEQKKELDTLIQDKADNHTIADWIEVCSSSSNSIYNLLLFWLNVSSA